MNIEITLKHSNLPKCTEGELLEWVSFNTGLKATIAAGNPLRYQPFVFPMLDIKIKKESMLNQKKRFCKKLLIKKLKLCMKHLRSGSIFLPTRVCV